MLPHGAGVQKGRDPPPETPAVRRKLRWGKPCSQGTRTEPLRQRLQLWHEKRSLFQYFWYWFSLQPHTVFLLTVQEEISTWPISGEGERRSVSLSVTPTPTHSTTQYAHALLPTPAAQTCIPSQVDRHAHPSPCPLDTS